MTSVFEKTSSGKASRVLAFLLEKRGHDAHAVVTDQLEQPLFPSARHGLVIIETPDGKRTIADPTYKAFLRHLGVQEEHLPEEDILLLGTGEVLTISLQLAELAISHGSKAASMPKKKLVNYFTTLFNLELYKPIGRGLESDIERFDSDSDSVSKGTGKMIEVLRKEGAC